MSDEAKKSDDGTCALAWIRGFERGATNNPPDNCGDHLYPKEQDEYGSYDDGWKLGRKIRAKTGVDDSSTLVVTGYPDGTEVWGLCEYLGIENDAKPTEKFGVTPLRCAIGSGNWRIFVKADPPPAPDACQFIGIGVETRSQITINNGTISGLYGIGPFAETPPATPHEIPCDDVPKPDGGSK